MAAAGSHAPLSFAAPAMLALPSYPKYNGDLREP
jgi:hypothetical protein